MSVRIAVVLHDVVEDTSWMLLGLRKEGSGPEERWAVDGLTRRDGKS